MKKLLTLASFAAALVALAACGNQAQEEPQTQPTQNEQAMTKQSGNFIFEAETPWDDAGGGVVRQVLGYNDNIMMVKVKFKKGQEGAMHSHPHSQVTYVASGKFEFTVGDVTRIVEAGDALYKQPNIPHGCVCLEDGILIDCFNPMRDTFIK
ncbi:MAG: cupin domain-containing protein [Bacteroidales bacterium]|nr:cupin domain-containing protein [Bacteroidales bacterium]